MLVQRLRVWRIELLIIRVFVVSKDKDDSFPLPSSETDFDMLCTDRLPATSDCSGHLTNFHGLWRFPTPVWTEKGFPLGVETG